MTKIAGWVLVIVGLAAIAWFGVLPRVRPHIFHGTVIQSSTAAPAVDLISHEGERVSLEDFEGEVVVIYFGYTFCPDVCPATLADLDEALELMGDGAEDVRVIMVSVDPERDTPEVLARYVPAFNDDFVGLTGTRQEVAQLATVYGVYFEKRDVEGAAGYLVDHTASFLVVDKSGFLKLVLPFGTSPEDIADDLAYLAG
ncbi:MAG TPA: SCO family protein [Acidimicrobiia bacterium]|jgi:protein SCO1/2|nr:SCO family protein [Acidimicrobiia bacterium]